MHILGMGCAQMTGTGKRMSRLDAASSCLQDAIDRISQLEAAGRLTGVMDDRGKVCTIQLTMP